MESKRNKVTAQGLHQFEVTSNSSLNGDYEEIFVLLHGFSEKGATIYKRLGDRLHRHFEDLKKKVLIVAPNGLYAMPKAHPLEKSVKPEDLLQGFAWYFYHASTDTFLVDYQVPAVTLKNWIEDQLPSAPVTIIGYSQGGYLAPFLGLQLKEVKRVIGINCSFRESMFDRLPDFPLYQFQGDKDTIIDINLCHERFEKLKKRGLNAGEFIWAKGIDHKLTPELSQMIIDSL